MKFIDRMAPNRSNRRPENVMQYVHCAAMPDDGAWYERSLDSERSPLGHPRAKTTDLYPKLLHL